MTATRPNGLKKVTKTNINKELCMGNMGLVKELWGFLMTRKKWWLFPIIIILLLLGLLIIFTESSAVAPFIYTLF